MEIKSLKLNKADNVAVIVEPGFKGNTTVVSGETYTLNEDIHTGHKIALCDIANGGDIIKYGKVIGRASADIKKGDWVHTHNVEDTTEEICRLYAQEYRAKTKAGK